MRKMVMLLFVMIDDVFDSGGPGLRTNERKCGPGYKLGCDHLWFRHCNRSGTGGARARQSGCGGVRSNGSQSCGAFVHSAGADSRPDLYRVAGIVHARDYLRESCIKGLRSRDFVTKEASAKAGAFLCKNVSCRDVPCHVSGVAREDAASVRLYTRVLAIGEMVVAGYVLRSPSQAPARFSGAFSEASTRMRRRR